MSDQQAKKLNLALHLNPVVSGADRVAMGALQQWYEKTKQSYGDQAAPELEGVIRTFHHDIYLAGLHLYLINPRLCSHVAQALEQTDQTLDALVRQLTACGLWSAPAETPVEKSDSAFSALQLEQLERLLASVTAPAAGAGEIPQPLEDSGVTALMHQLAEQQEQLGAMHAELQRLRALAEEQTQQLRQMKSLAPAAPAPEPAKPQTADEMDVSNMGTQIAQMQKIRKKGVF